MANKQFRSYYRHLAEAYKPKCYKSAKRVIWIAILAVLILILSEVFYHG